MSKALIYKVPCQRPQRIVEYAKYRSLMYIQETGIILYNFLLQYVEMGLFFFKLIKTVTFLHKLVPDNHYICFCVLSDMPYWTWFNFSLTCQSGCDECSHLPVPNAIRHTNDSWKSENRDELRNNQFFVLTVSNEMCKVSFRQDGFSNLSYSVFLYYIFVSLPFLEELGLSE